MVLLLNLLLSVKTTPIPTYGINVYCPNMFSCLTEKVIDAYICYVTLSSVVVNEIKIFEDHVKSLTSTDYDESKVTPINVILVGLFKKILTKVHETVELSSIFIGGNIFDDEYFDEEANSAYVAVMKNNVESRTLVLDCIHNFVHFAKIPREQKIGFL